MKMKYKTLLFCLFLGLAGTLAAAEPSSDVAQVQFNLNVVWTILGGILVFAMQAGFAMVETGLTRAKNAANIMMKNLMDFALGSLAYAEQFVRTEYQERNRLVRNALDGLEERETVFPGDGSHDVELAVLAQTPEGDDAAGGDADAAVRDDGVHVHVHDHSQPLAVGTISFG